MPEEKVDIADNWSKDLSKPFSEEEQADPELATKNRTEVYNKHAGDYDGLMAKITARGPDLITEFIHEKMKSDFEARILDIGCGTGRVAEELQVLGPYANMVGLDPSEGMLAIAEQKGIYKETLCQYMYLDCGLEHDGYDAAVCSGGFAPGHMKSECLIELYNVVKPGGYIAFTMREEHLYNVEDFMNNFKPIIEKLSAEGKWKVMRDEVIPNYASWGLEGHFYAFRKLRLVN